VRIERVSLEPSRRCSKGCSFCYNGSSALGDVGFTAAQVIGLGEDLARNGVTSLSIGGGEPLEWTGLFETLEALGDVLSRSFTTNGLEFERRPALLDEVARVRPDKVHVSIHATDSEREVTRVLEQVLALDERGVPTGVNLLVKRSRLDSARHATERLRGAGLGPEHVVFLPARGVPGELPTPEEVAWVATGARSGGPGFQSMSCLRGCARSDRFVSIGADWTVAWCSYTVARRRLTAPTWAALIAALSPSPHPLGLVSCDQATLRGVAP
jgi:hypothetical protein